MKSRMNECPNEWKSEWMKVRRTKGQKEWRSEGMKVRRNEGQKEWRPGGRRPEGKKVCRMKSRKNEGEKEWRPKKNEGQKEWRSEGKKARRKEGLQDKCKKEWRPAITCRPEHAGWKTWPDGGHIVGIILSLVLGPPMHGQSTHPRCLNNFHQFWKKDKGFISRLKRKRKKFQAQIEIGVNYFLLKIPRFYTRKKVTI